MKATKFAGILAMIGGIIMVIAGIGTYAMVSSQLSAENITVPDDSPMLPGAHVSGPFSAYAQAEIIKVHALAGSEGKTYAELGALATKAKADKDDALATKYTNQRTSVMNASFLRASLFTSVVSYGIAALVIGLGILFGLIGWALMILGDGVVAPKTVTVAEPAKA